MVFYQEDQVTMAKYRIEVLSRASGYVCVFYDESQDMNISIGSIRLEDKNEVAKWQKIVQQMNQEG